MAAKRRTSTTRSAKRAKPRARKRAERKNPPDVVGEIVELGAVTGLAVGAYLLVQSSKKTSSAPPPPGTAVDVGLGPGGLGYAVQPGETVAPIYQGGAFK